MNILYFYFATLIFLLPFLSRADLYEIEVSDINRKPVQISAYKGKVLMIVNTASSCGYTPQYNDLEAVYQKYKSKHFAVLGFPSNDFGGQESGSNEEIKKFCDLKTGRYKISFPLFAKSNVNSLPQSSLFEFLTKKANADLLGPVKWNFEKFLISKQGKLVARFPSSVKPTSPEVLTALQTEISK